MPRIRCQCGHVLFFMPGQAGKRVQCPECSAILVLPLLNASETPDAPPVLGEDASIQDRLKAPLEESVSYLPASPEEGELTLEDRPTLPRPPQEVLLPEAATRKPSDARKRYPRASHQASDAGPPPDFFLLLLRAFKYPLEENGLVAIIVGVITFGAAFFFWRVAAYFPLIGGIIADVVALILTIILGGYLAGYLFTIIHHSASGDPVAPDWPDLTDYEENVFKPLLFILALGILSLGPSFAYDRYVENSSQALYAALLGVGLFYMPMGMLCIALRNDLAALNPLVVIRAITSVPVRYLIVWLLVVVVVCLQRWGMSFVAQHLPIPIIGIILWFGIYFYFILVLGRVIGVLYHADRNKLKWLGG